LGRNAGQFNNRLVSIAAKKAGDLSNGVNFLGAKLLHDFIGPGEPGFTVAAKFYLYQLMVIESGFDLRHYVFAQAFVSYHHDRFQMMRQAAEIANLLMGKRHAWRPDGVNWVWYRVVHSITQGMSGNGKK